MPFHSDNRQLSSPGQIQAGVGLIRDLENIDAQKGWAAQNGKAAARALAYTRYDRSIALDQDRRLNMSNGGNGRGAIRYNNGGGGATYDTSNSSGFNGLVLIFWASVIWIAINKMGYGPQAQNVIGVLWNFVLSLIPVFVKIIMFGVDVLTAFINFLIHIH